MADDTDELPGSPGTDPTSVGWPLVERRSSSRTPPGGVDQRSPPAAAHRQPHPQRRAAVAVPAGRAGRRRRARTAEPLLAQLEPGRHHRRSRRVHGGGLPPARGVPQRRQGAPPHRHRTGRCHRRHLVERRVGVSVRAVPGAHRHARRVRRRRCVQCPARRRRGRRRHRAARPQRWCAARPARRRALGGVARPGGVHQRAGAPRSARRRSPTTFRARPGEQAGRGELVAVRAAASGSDPAGVTRPGGSARLHRRAAAQHGAARPAHRVPRRPDPRSSTPCVRRAPRQRAHTRSITCHRGCARPPSR